MSSFVESVLGRKINNTRIRPIVLKIIIVFIVFMLLSNFSTNYINLISNRSREIKLMKELLIKDLKNFYNYLNSQYEIYQYNGDLNKSTENIKDRGKLDLTKNKSIYLAVKEDKSPFFIIRPDNKSTDKIDLENKLFDSLQNSKNKGITEDFISFKLNGENYFGVYKYNTSWKSYIIRAEEYNEFYSESTKIFIRLSITIIILTFLSAVLGVIIINFILRFLRVVTESILDMLNSQKLDLIEMKGASNDDITFLGTAFNSLSSNINNLMGIFLKFVNKDTALKAYSEKVIRLEGSRKDLTILFSDIKSFTFMTETLGIDIIRLLNIHYERSIHHILANDGVIGSIIGDALLAVYGTMEEGRKLNKSYQALLSAYEIQSVTESLRRKMHEKRMELENKGVKLTEEEERFFKAILIEVGVGIDGGDVFYGNIGSTSRMTNTVIGDNVNSASRLEGLTRVYKLPVICSEYVKKDIERNVKNHNYEFIEIDTVQVKGKTEGKKIYFPLDKNLMNDEVKAKYNLFSEALTDYYNGNWESAGNKFKETGLFVADVFIDRVSNYKCPEDWRGVWAMTSK